MDFDYFKLIMMLLLFFTMQAIIVYWFWCLHWSVGLFAGAFLVFLDIKSWYNI